MALGGQEPRILVLGDGFGELPEHSRAGYRASQEVTAGEQCSGEEGERIPALEGAQDVKEKYRDYPITVLYIEASVILQYSNKHIPIRHTQRREAWGWNEPHKRAKGAQDSGTPLHGSGQRRKGCKKAEGWQGCYEVVPSGVSMLRNHSWTWL